MRMTKRTIKETIREFDKDGKVIRETIPETVEDDDTTYYPVYTNPPSPGTPYINPYTTTPAAPILKPEVTCCCSKSGDTHG